jgi:subtilisin family serine protease
MMNQAGALVQADAARTKYPSIDGAGYTVAIIDSGVDYTHPALIGRCVGGYNFVGNNTNFNDDYGHGTHVAGIAASNDATYTGIAPGAGYAAVKVVSSLGSATWANVAKGLQWVIDNREKYNIVAVNMSLGDGGSYDFPVTGSISAQLATLKDDGVFTAVASGNSWYTHSPAGGPAQPGIGYPAADPSVVSVGAVWTANFGRVAWSNGAIDYTTGPDRITSFTDRSATMLNLLAPGAEITSTAYNWEGSNPDFVTMSGTSMAAPEVAGLAVLIHEAIDEHWAPSLRPTGAEWQDTILDIMQNHGVTVYDGDDENDNVAHLNCSFTRIDVLNALDYVMSVPEPSIWAMLLAVAVLSLVWRRRQSR